MASYEVILCDRTGRRIGLLPGYGQTPLQFQKVLSGTGSATVVPKLTLPLISGANRQNLTSWGSELAIFRTSGPGQTGLVWEGPVTKPHADVDSDSLTITAATPWAWLNGERLITEPHSYGGWDQLDVARDLIKAYTTGLGPAGDLRMALGGGKSGVKVSEIYLPTDNKQAGQAVEDLAGADNGFDFDIISTIDPGSGRVVRRWQPYFPHKGTRLSQRLAVGKGGLRGFSVEQATQISTRVVGTGQGTFHAAAGAHVEGQFGIHSDGISLTDANSLAKLQGQVNSYLKYRTPPVNIVSFSYKVTDQTPFGMIDTGDTVPVFAERGWAYFDDDVRIISVATSVDAAGVENVTCTAAGVPGGIS